MVIRLMDEDERKPYKTLEVEPRKRTPRIEHDGRFYEAARQDEDGAWIYRLAPGTK